MAYETTDQLLAEISDYWDKRPSSNIYNLVDAFNEPFEAISDNAEKVERWRALQDAKGTTLDLFGTDIQTYRPSSDDDDYRFLIHIMELISRAQGTVPSIYKITSSALEEPNGYKVWKTAIRHVSIQVPLDACRTVQMQKFISNNLQKMLAMGYWIDTIYFRTTTHLPLYVGVGTQSKFHETQRSKTIWWTGWKAKTSKNLYVGAYTQYQHKTSAKSNTIWWSGWKARAPATLSIAIAGQIAKTSIWHSSTLWHEDQSQIVHTGLTVGNKIITKTTQSITTE